MVTGAQKTMCGACGNETFEIFAQGKGSDYRLHLECTKCKSTTVVSVERPLLKLDWGEGSDGILSYKN